ncbi:hypothetical protein BDZ97DRAFT_1759482 [Flammula alnicola]|nr:hypothetical protein BDZ97DRAFT_1759482 [Flammula alnicola]
MANTNLEPPSLEDLIYVLNHVFLPPKLPQKDDNDTDHDVALCRFAYNASLEFAGFLSQCQQGQWSIVSRMLNNLLKTTRSLEKDVLATNILGLGDGEAPRYYDVSNFEVSPSPEAVMDVEGKLVCSYPGPAVELPLDIAHDRSFVEQLVSFLVHMDVDRLDAEATTTKAGSKVPETRGTTHPRYISQLLSMILCGIGKEAEVDRITKRIADDVCWDSARNPWRRSSLWLVLRVAIQTTADSRETYKAFMVFFQAQLLQLFLDHDLSSELLHTARVKTSRRVHKLGASASPRLLQVVETVSRAIEQRLQERWSEEQRLQAVSPSYTPDPATFEKDATISLLKSRDYLAKIMSPDLYTDTFTTFHPSHFLRLRDSYDFHHPNGLSQAVQADPYVALADFEFFVQKRLDGWVIENRHDESACEKLGACLDQYISAAKTQYSSNPEDESLMLLTIMELWVALDAIAVFHCPLLLDYSPEIPASFLDPLLLRRAKFIERAARIQLYLRNRHSKATIATSIYSDHLDHTTFAVRYFQQSSSLYAVKASIERDAALKRTNKHAELQGKNERHAWLTKEIDRRRCEYDVFYSWSYHSRSCYKCKLQGEAESLRIDVHEWPVPSNSFEAEAAVFELKCPPVFAIWRTRTYQILRDIGMAHVSVQSEFTPHALLEDYEGLVTWSKRGTSGRITFGSDTKSFLKSHYRDVKIPAHEDSVCVNNGLHFRLYDSIKGENVLSSFNLNLDSYCTLRLPKDGEGLYQHLQYAVTHTTHTHNETIVNQGDCPMNLSMHEQLAFSNLRCGSQLQWKNIARELRSNALTFSREEVHTLLTQAAWQIGPLSKDGSIRDWHFELGELDFGLVFIRETMDLLSHVEANWSEGTTVKSINAQLQVRKNGYALLRKAREVTYKWMHEIVDKLQDAVDDDELSELQRRACEMAATCRATFDVDAGTHLDALLSSEFSADVAILIECAIMIHDNTPPHLGRTFPDFQKLLHRDRRLSHFLEPFLSKLIHADKCGLDIAITSVWSGYHPGDGGWQQLPEPNSRWLTSFTAAASPGQRAQQVHYNMLDGKLLVDGKPLGRLPREIVGHSTYKRIFGQKILDVIPADMPGMDYATPSFVYGYQVFFALRGSQSLIIRTRTPSHQVFELIPHKVLLEDFPALFATEHAHWMDIHNGEIEFRPLDRLWDRSPQNWRLAFLPDGPSKMIHGKAGTRHLVDIQSGTFQGIAARIRPLEHSEYLTTIYDAQSHTISIELPRQLVLRHNDPRFEGLPGSRCVLIPRGVVQFSLSLDQNHVRVYIDTCTKFIRQVTWHKYEINSDLGLLVGNVNLTSRLYRIYLHALCSHPLPDPLTSQTGTDHALQELGAASCFSFQRLTKADVELLRLIGSITLRHYYPKHLRVMQTIKWSPHLPALSQHGMFDTTVCNILQYAQSLTIFPELKDTEVDLDYKCGGDSFLMARATRRNAIYYERGVDISPAFDRRYDSRDSPRIADHDSDGIEALKTSQLVYAWPVGLTRPLETSELLETFKEWRHMSEPIPETSLIYTQEWLHLDLPAKWLSIYDLCRQIGQPASKKFELVFSFTALAYGSRSLRKFIPVLLAFATIRRPLFSAPPLHLSYDLQDGFEPLQGQLSQRRDETFGDFHSRRSMHYNDISRSKIDNAMDYLMKQWPCSSPQSPFYQYDNSRWFNGERIMSEVAKYFASCSRNCDLRSFASQVTGVLQANYIAPPLIKEQIPRFSFVPQLNVSIVRLDSPFTLANLLSSRTNSAPPRSTRMFGTGAPINSKQPGQPIDTSNLQDLISQFERNSHSALSRLYSKRLERRRSALHRGQQTSMLPEHLPPINDCIAYRDQCKSRLRDLSLSVSSALAPSTTTENILEILGLWPRIHHRTMLHPLASTANIPLSPEWADSLTAFAEVFIEYQHSQRLLEYALQSDAENFFKELDNASFNRSDTERNPDWLLIQIQGNFITRAIQYDVAREMVTPSSSDNTVLQLNMGEGKSHVIVPLVAVALADLHKLVRVVVLKPLAGQMFHLLVERISGLSNRRIFHSPIQRIRNLFKECARVQGVLVTQPEHILSFRLMVIDRTLSSGSPPNHVAQELKETQAWLASTSRDILDESDELLHVRYQLIYTMDQQQPLDDGQDRWTTIQKVFDLVRRHIWKLHEEFPEQVELLEHRAAQVDKGEFSMFVFLEPLLLGHLFPALPKMPWMERLITLVSVVQSYAFIKEHSVDDQTCFTVQSFYKNSGLWKGLLLIRGLLAHGILIYVLSQRRWRVDYGLDLKRSLLAVPYRAKDVPSLRSDFGHPDVAICLTCLSYYYGGLTTSQVQECFELLIKLDNPPLEYEKWVKRGRRSIPDFLRQLIGVNTKDMQTFKSDVVPIFKHNQAVIDFFLSQVVFPKDAKEFPSKLGTSGWDLAEHKANFTTGFSGTNDNCDLLPTSITQIERDNQIQTNAQVLWYLLRPENDRYICTQGADGQSRSAMEFLEFLVREPKEVRVLLDVGAQMLEMTNQQLVKHWLSLRQDVMAGVFFDDADNLSVLRQDGVVEPLYSSSFFRLLDQCIIYLDDAHTRGTDLKLPRNFRAVVTLGPKVTKDRLVQGCMRMRKLGHGQSVVFCAPPEIDRRIREAENIGSSCPVQVIDVLSWVMSNTCTDIEHHIPHWVEQGVDFHRRRTEENAWLQPAARSLDEMYGLTSQPERSTGSVIDIPDMHERLQALGSQRYAMHEWTRSKKGRVPPAVHYLDEEVRCFVRQGTIPTNSDAFFPFMTPLRSETDTLNPQNPWSRQLLATRDFMTTTRDGKEKSVLTDYLRPVNWIVSTELRDGSGMIFVVMSPYEINLLLQDIRASKYVRLHMYAPRTTQAMKPFDDLTFYCVRHYRLRAIWHPQPSTYGLYLDQYETYLRLCLLLGVSSSETAEYSSVESDRFVPKRGQIGEMVEVCLFDESPLPLLKRLFGLRRKGMSYQQTHLGKILHARLLFQEDFEE